MADLRSWLNDVDKIGQLMTVEGVHWDLELSTLTEVINERSKNRPAILFDRIKNYPSGYRVAANLVSSVDRLAMTLGMKPELSDLEFVQSWRRRGKGNGPVKGEMATGGASFEDVLEGEESALVRFPRPRRAGMVGGGHLCPRR